MAAGHLDKAEEIFKQGLKHHPSDVMLLHIFPLLTRSTISAGAIGQRIGAGELDVASEVCIGALPL